MHFLDKIVPLLKAIVWEVCQRFFSSDYSFGKIKGCYWWKCKFYSLCVCNLAFGLLQISHKSEKVNDVTICWLDVIVKFFWRHFVFLVNFSYWSMFHANIVTVLKLWQFSFIRDWNPKIGDTPVWALPNNWRLERVRDTRFKSKLSSEMLQNAEKWQSFSFYRFWVINPLNASVVVI